MDDIIAALEALENEGSFCAEQTLPASALHLKVKGVGDVKLPLAPGAVKSLIDVAQPAQFGWRDQTLLDKRVRNTWEIPAERIKIGDAGWRKALQSALDELAIDLGLPGRGRKTSALRAHLHNMLIYQPGQFFRAHQDTEKLPGMVATLIVVLPSAHEGGALIVEHQGDKRRFQGAAPGRKLKLIAFYADCQHELRPVRKGYRVALTYNLTLGGASGSGGSGDFPATQLAAGLRRYFDTPQPAPTSRAPQKTARPRKWVYLLDHQYTQESLDWKHLKNGDALRAKVLTKVAQELNLEICLALAEISESWEAYSEYDDDYFGSSRRRRWESDDDELYDVGDEDDEDATWQEQEGTEEDSYVLESFIDGNIELRHWMDARGKPLRRGSESVSSEELCMTTETKEFDLFAQEYEGYLGNYGNTLERTYHRAAIVLVPGRRAPRRPGQGSARARPRRKASGRSSRTSRKS